MAVLVAFATPFGNFISDAMIGITRASKEVGDHAVHQGYVDAQKEYEEYFAKLKTEKTVTAGLYQVGTEYEKFIASWNSLCIEKVIINKKQGTGYLIKTNYDNNSGTNASASKLVGDLAISGNSTIIANNGFRNCHSLASVRFSSILSIGENAFNGCNNLFTLIITNPSLQEIKNGAFVNTGIKEIVYNGTKAQWNSINIDTAAFDAGNILVHCTDGNLYIGV